MNLQIFKMPEVVRGAARLALANHSGGGFFIRRARVASPGAAVVKGGVKPLARHAMTPFSNKENVPPAGVVRASPKRRSPLPDWYPRTPLRDITSVVKVMAISWAVLQISVNAMTISYSYYCV
jgi:hypothetical protein